MLLSHFSKQTVWRKAGKDKNSEPVLSVQCVVKVKGQLLPVEFVSNFVELPPHPRFRRKIPEFDMVEKTSWISTDDERSYRSKFVFFSFFS